MKKFIVLFTSTYIISASAGSSAVLTAAALGSLGVLIEPIAMKLFDATKKDIVDIMKGKGCPIACKGPWALPCRSSRLFSMCKQTCQTVKQMGGYQIRIRFGQGWSLTKCLNQAIAHGAQKQKDKENRYPMLVGSQEDLDKLCVQNWKGKENPYSIAVYSQEDLDKLLRLIAQKMAAEEIVGSNGAQITKEQLKDEGKTKEELINEAALLIEHIEASLATDISKTYGPQ